jgi:hypothetical protein
MSGRTAHPKINIFVPVAGYEQAIVSSLSNSLAKLMQLHFNHLILAVLVLALG